MKKNLARKIMLSILAGAVLMSSSVVWADNLVDSDGKVLWEEKTTYYLRNETNNPDGNVPVGNHTKSFFGAYDRDSNDVTGGKVTISGERITISGDVYGGKSTNGGATKNRVIINDVSNITYGVYGGYSASGNVIENTVTINGGTFGDKVCGGYALNSGNSGASATDNTVTISGGTISGDETEKVLVRGGWSSANGDATSNEVIISGNGNVECANIYGGSTVASDVVGKAEGNTVTISSNCKVIDANVYGGHSNYGTDNATCNTVNISGNTYLKGTSLYGGYVINNPCYGGASAPNTLNIGIDEALKNTLDPDDKYGLQVGAWNNKEVKSIAGFDVINFNYINWSNGGNVVETEDLELNNTIVGKVVIGSGTVENGEWMNLISSTNSVTGNFEKQTNMDITIRTSLTTSEIVTGDIELIDKNLKLTITTDTSDGVSGGTGSSTISATPSGAESFVDAIEEKGSSNNPAYDAINAVMYEHSTAPEKEQKAALTNMLQLGEAGGQSATAANISRNVSCATVNRMSFGGRGGVRHRGGHGPADFNEKDGSAVWAQYVHGKDKVDGMALADGVTTSYESQFNGVVLGVDFKEVGKYQSGIAFNYGEGDSHTKYIAFSRSDYDFWGIGYYGAVKNADSNVIFDINYAKTDSEVKQFNGGVELEAEPETTTISAGVKIEKLIDRGAMQFVPYAGLRFMSIDTDEYSANYLGKEAFNYSADRQNIWLLPVGVSFRQENVYDGGWVVTPKVDLSYIWAFGDTENEMTVRTPDVAEAARLGYTVMNDGSFLGSIGLEAEKGDWTFGVAYSYQKSSDSRSDRWYVDAKYSF